MKSSITALCWPKPLPKAAPTFPHSLQLLPKPPAGGNVGSVFKDCVTHSGPGIRHSYLLLALISHSMHHFLFIYTLRHKRHSSVEVTPSLLALVPHLPSFTDFLEGQVPFPRSNRILGVCKN